MRVILFIVTYLKMDGLILPLQRVLARDDGVIVGDSVLEFPEGTRYRVRRIYGRPKPGTFVIAVARRGWMDPPKRRLIKNFIVKQVESIEVS